MLAAADRRSKVESVELGEYRAAIPTLMGPIIWDTKPKTQSLESLSKAFTTTFGKCVLTIFNLLFRKLLFSRLMSECPAADFF